jgi:hypothetical protein
MRLFVQKLKHNRQWYRIRMCGFSKWFPFNEVHTKIFFFVRCSNCSVIGFSTTYIHLFTCNIPLWYMNSSGVQSVRHTVVTVALYIFTDFYMKWQHSQAVDVPHERIWEIR